MAKISVIVPVYNVEKYLPQCIDSILSQTFADFELILVDDGSPDNCPVICDEWAKKDSRIKVIHKENGGVSSARNLGLNVATGEYICFVDADDYIEKTTFETAVDSKADLFVFGMVYDYYDNNRLIRTRKAGDNCNLRFEKADNEKIKDAFSKANMASPCNKFYKHSIIKEHQLLFSPKCVMYEDLKFNLDYCRHIKSFCCIDTGLYHYRQFMQPQILKRKFKGLFENADEVFVSLKPYFIQTQTIFDNLAFQAYFLEMNSHLMQNKRKAKILKSLYRNENFISILKKIKQGKRIKIITFFCKIKAYSIAAYVAKTFIRR